MLKVARLQTKRNLVIFHISVQLVNLNFEHLTCPFEMRILLCLFSIYYDFGLTYELWVLSRTIFNMSSINN